MKICVCCCTYKRPVSLGYLIRCFERQTHADRELLILDDAGQYGQPWLDRTGPRWTLVSIPVRFRSLGEKRNALAALAPVDADALAIWDDDDLYFPWALEATAAALENADWSRPSIALHPRMELPGNRWVFRQHETGGLYHGGHAYRRELFDRAGWYPADSGPEDQALFRKMESLAPRIADPIALGFRPFYVFGGRAASGLPSLSNLGCNQRAYAAMGKLQSGAVESFAIREPPWFDVSAPEIEPIVHPRPF